MACVGLACRRAEGLILGPAYVLSAPRRQLPEGVYPPRVALAHCKVAITYV